MANIRNFRPPDLMEVMMLSLCMGNNFWITYITCFIKNDTIKVCGPKNAIGQSIFGLEGIMVKNRPPECLFKATRPC